MQYSILFCCYYFYTVNPSIWLIALKQTGNFLMRRFESAAKSFKTFHINFAMSSRGFKYTKGKKVDETG